MFPLVAKNGGVLERAGHTEASVDISKLAKLNPSAVICEVMNEDGRMARFDDLLKFSKKHKLKIASIEDLISYRLKNEKFIFNAGNKIINVKKYGKFDFKIFRNNLDGAEHYAITKGIFGKSKSVRVRVISTNIINNLVDFNKKQIDKSLRYLSKYSSFALVLIKDQNLNLSKNSNDITKNNNILRYYGIGAQIIKDLKIKNMILVSRSNKKMIGLDGYGIKITKQEIIK